MESLLGNAAIAVVAVDYYLFLLMIKGSQSEMNKRGKNEQERQCGDIRVSMLNEVATTRT